MNGTIALPKSVFSSAVLAASGRLSHAMRGCFPPAVEVSPQAWLTGQTLSYLMRGEEPVSVYPEVTHSHPPWAEGHTARMLDASVLVADLRYTIVPSQSCLCPRPSDGASLGKYLDCVRISSGSFEGCHLTRSTSRRCFRHTRHF